MDTYVKGFSYMPATDINLNVNLNYVESGELEQTWKTARRERIKQRDERIWEEFVQERDVVNVICNDDPYQFLEQLPESCLRELLETEFQKTKQEVEEEIQEIQEEPQEPEDHNNQTIATEADSVDSSDETFDDKEDVSGSSPEEANESAGSSPCTVREMEEEPQLAPSRPASGKSKSSENVTNMVESSIYCAKIRELRSRICEELRNIVSCLEQKVLINIEARDAEKLSKRCAEFCSRFSRVHVYQLQRQLHDVRRHGAAAGARHTRARALLPRLLSLHQAELQTVQVVGRFVSVSGWWGETATLDSLVCVLKEAAAPDLYVDTKLTFDDTQDIEAACDKLTAAVGDYTARVTEFLNNMSALQTSSSTKKNKNNKKKLSNSKYKLLGVDSRLSMYSQDTNRKTQALYRTALSGTSRSRVNTTIAVDSDIEPLKEVEKAKREKSPRVRRRRVPSELHTLVEAVAPSTLSVLSREVSPRVSPRKKHLVPPLQLTPKTNKTPKSKSNSSPRQETPRKKVNEEDSVRAKSRKNTEHEAKVKEDSRNFIIGGDASTVEGAECAGNKMADVTSEDVSKLLRELCRGDGLSTRNNHVENSKNVQLVCVKSSNPQPTTPQLLRILEETIQKKSPRQISRLNDPEKHRMTLNISDEVSEKLFQYRTKFVQHMLTSSLYANSDVGKPWEMIGSISEQIIKELLQNCVKEMEVREITEDLYKSELC